MNVFMSPSKGHESLAPVTAFNPDRMGFLERVPLGRQTRGRAATEPPHVARAGVGFLSRCRVIWG